MPLADVVLEIAAEMAETAERSGGLGVSQPSVESWAKQLRRAAQAASGTTVQAVPAYLPGDPIGNKIVTGGLPVPEPAADNMAPRRLTLFEKARRQLEGQEEAMHSTGMALVVGGSHDGDSELVPPDAQPGYQRNVDGEVYVLNDTGRLVFSASKTCEAKGLKVGGP